MYKRSDFILSFEKRFIESLALKKLRKLDPYKYKDAIVEGCEKPDIQNIKRSIGVEVKSCDFKQMYMWHKYYVRSLLEVFRMENIKPIKYEEIADYCIGDYAKENIEDFIHEGVYLERKDKLKELKTYEDFQELNSQDKLYYKSDLDWNVKLDNNLNIENIQPTGFFIGQIVYKLRDTVNEKEVKFKNYKKINENNLYIQAFSTDEEEYKEFEETTDLSSSCFDYIYISNFSSEDRSIYIIDTKE